MRFFDSSYFIPLRLYGLSCLKEELLPVPPALQHSLDVALMINSMDGLFKGLGLRYPALEWRRMKLHRKWSQVPGLKNGDPEVREDLWREYGGSLLLTAEQENSPWLRNLVIHLSESTDWERIENHVNRGQMSSKLWFLEELAKVRTHLGLTYIMGGWYGALASLIASDHQFKFRKIVNFEIEKLSVETSLILNDHLGAFFRSELRDMLQVKLGENVCRPDTLINTSCEHIPNFKEWFDSIPKGVFVCLQSNDYFAEPEHCNCVNTLEDFQDQAPLSRLLSAKQMKSPNGKYTRFLLLGYK